MAELGTLQFSRRVRTVLERHGITDTDELTARNARELLGLSGLGRSALTEILQALEVAGLALVSDPYASYVCARHGEASWDTNLASLFLCYDCTERWKVEAFAGESPVYVGNQVDGYCLNCNIWRHDVRLRQWFLCGTCERVARSIGRSVVAERYVSNQWEALVAPRVPGIALVSTDEPALRRRERDASDTKKPEIDFVGLTAAREPIFGFELKTGKSFISGSSRVGTRMSEFQLDASDCDDITAVMKREEIPVYLLHVQVIDRAVPPTVQYVPLGAWWTDVFRMREYFDRVHMRSREARDAAYFKTAMFEDFETFGEHVSSGQADELAKRLRAEGIPQLYAR